MMSTISSNFIWFAAIGCSDLVPPEDAWLKRNNNEAVIGCYSSQQTWQLRCQDQQWIGVVGNCSLSSYKFLSHSTFLRMRSLEISPEIFLGTNTDPNWSHIHCKKNLVKLQRKCWQLLPREFSVIPILCNFTEILQRTSCYFTEPNL